MFIAAVALLPDIVTLRVYNLLIAYYYRCVHALVIFVKVKRITGFLIWLF